MSVSLSINQESTINNGTQLGQLATESTKIINLSQLDNAESIKGQRVKAVLYVDSATGSGVTGTVDFQFKPVGISVLQTPANNQMTVEENKPLVLNTPVEIEQITLNPSLSAVANWRLDLFTE